MPLKTIQVEKDALIVVWTTSINGSYLIWIKCKFRFVNFDKLWHTAVAHRIKSWDVVFINKLVFVIALYLILSSLISWVWEIPASCNKEITSQFFLAWFEWSSASKSKIMLKITQRFIRIAIDLTINVACAANPHSRLLFVSIASPHVCKYAL